MSPKLWQTPKGVSARFNWLVLLKRINSHRHVNHTHSHTRLRTAIQPSQNVHPMCVSYIEFHIVGWIPVDFGSVNLLHSFGRIPLIYSATITTAVFFIFIFFSTLRHDHFLLIIVFFFCLYNSYYLFVVLC